MHGGRPRRSRASGESALLDARAPAPCTLRAVEVERRSFGGSARGPLDETFSSLLERAPVAIAVWRGPEHVFEVASAHFLEVFGRRGSVLGRTVREVFHELPADAPPFELLDRAYATGVSHTESELRC